MHVTIQLASLEDATIIQNLGRFYVYDMSRYCGFLQGWETPENGLFECKATIDISRYWKEPNRHPFLIKVDNELSGFALVSKIGSTPDVDWHLEEFFIISKYQGKGIGSYAAQQIFNRFPGSWEVMQIPENKGAVIFWEKVIRNYTHGRFSKEQKIIPQPKPHPMIVLKFDTVSNSLPSRSHSKVINNLRECGVSAEKILFKEASPEENHLLQDAITDFNITAIKSLPRAESKKIDLMVWTAKGELIGGINSEWVNWGILFINLLFVKEPFRGKGYGSALLQEVEDRARSQGCYLSHLDTFDFQGKDFYIANGYTIFGILENCPKDHKRYYLKKEL